jgi:hypothetical protein
MWRGMWFFIPGNGRKVAPYRFASYVLTIREANANCHEVHSHRSGKQLMVTSVGAGTALRAQISGHTAPAWWLVLMESGFGKAVASRRAAKKRQRCRQRGWKTRGGGFGTKSVPEESCGSHSQVGTKKHPNTCC